MDEAKVMVQGKSDAKRTQEIAKERPSVLGWVRKAVRRLTKGKKKDLEIYPLF
jgi:hypothetical protein